MEFSFHFQKPLVGFLLALIFLLEWRRGWFHSIPLYARRYTFQTRHLLIGLVLLPVLGMMIFDAAVLPLVVNAKGPLFHGMRKLGESLSKNSEIWMALFGIYFWSLWRKARRVSETCVGVILATGLTCLAVLLFKFAFLRARPYSIEGPYSFFNPTGITEDAHAFQSLPSGDVGIIAGIASYLFFLFKHPVRWAFFIFPLCTAFSRIYNEKHWPSDTLASVILSLLAAKLVLDYQKFKAERNVLQ